MEQQIQRMNISDLKFEMLTSNRSWRSGIGHKQNATVTAGAKIAKGGRVYHRPAKNTYGGFGGPS